MSSRLACRSSTSRASCRRGHTPASVQSRSRRQQVTPEQPIRSAGTSAQDTPLRRAYTIPASAVRSSTGLPPGNRCRRGGRAGISGAIRSHRSLGTRSLFTPEACQNKAVEGGSWDGPWYRVHTEQFDAAFLPNAGEDVEAVDNVDVFVDLKDGSQWSPTIITLAQVEILMSRWATRGSPRRPLLLLLGWAHRP